MTERSFPWDGTTTGDAGPYSASDEARFYTGQFKSGVGIISSVNRSSGYFPGSGRNTAVEPWLITANSPEDLTVILEPGTGVVQGYLYDNDAQLTLTIAENTSGSTRFDFIVLEMNISNQQVRAQVVQGTPGAGAPSLTQTATVWQHSLALVEIASGDSTIADSDITTLGYNFPIQPGWGANQQLSNGTAPGSAISAWSGNLRYCQPTIAGYWANGETVLFSADGGNNFVGAYRYTLNTELVGPSTFGLNASGTIGTDLSYTATKDHFFVYLIFEIVPSSYNGATNLTADIEVATFDKQRVGYALDDDDYNALSGNFSLVLFAGRIECSVGNSIDIHAEISNSGGTTGSINAQYFGSVWI